MNDIDELEQEQREINLRKRLNQRFLNFIQQIETISKHDVNPCLFDIPYKELAFYGNTGRSIVKIMPTVNCFVNLTEFPFFLVTIDEIEHVHFERVMLSLRNFDMIIIFKDFQTVKKIGAIQSECLDTLKACIDYFGILYSEGPATLNWTNVLDEIRRDFGKFLEEGAWSFLRDIEEDESEEDRLEKQEDSDFDLDKEEGEMDGSDDDYSGSYAESSDVQTQNDEVDDDDDEGDEFDEEDQRVKLKQQREILKKQAMRTKYEMALKKQKNR